MAASDFGRDRPSEASEPEEPTRQGLDEAPDLPTFMASLGEKTAQGQVTALAYYGRVHRSLTEVTEQVLEPMFNEALIRMPDVGNALGNASRKTIGWMRRIPGKRGAFELTGAGENMVKMKLKSNAK